MHRALEVWDADISAAQQLLNAAVQQILHF